MKLATLDDGTRDGALLVVSRDLKRAVAARSVARTLQAAVENWSDCEPELRALSEALYSGRAPAAFDFDPAHVSAPLPRAYQWLDASAFHSHGDLMEKVFGLDPPPEKHQIPLMYQGGSDDFLGPRADVPVPSEALGIDFEAELGIVVDEVPMGTPMARALEHVKLLVLINDVSLRTLAAREMKSGFGWIQAKPSSSFAPLAVTPDEVGGAWRGGRIHLPVNVHWNGQWFGSPNAGAMGFGFDQLIAHAARTRRLSAGTIIGSGTVSNENFREIGSACIAERRGIELLDHGAPRTEFMKFGDTVRIEVLDAEGKSIFGAIDQRMVRAAAA
jgi:fumarylacetoacetate (FAA) hydrolase